MGITGLGLDPGERTLLLRTLRVLDAHPSMRAELGGQSTVARSLERMLSTRLGLVHLEGPVAPGSPEAGLLDKLRAREAELAAALAAEGSKQAWLRYETLRLLHPEPGPEPAASLSLADATLAWEQWQTRRPAGAIAKEKLAQNRAFFRHGAMLPLYWIRRRRIRRLLPPSVLAQPALAETFFAIEQVGPLVDNFAFDGAAGVPWSTSVAVADFAFFYMQLADELLDELAAASGGHDAVGAFVRTLYEKELSSRPLAGFTIEDFRGLGVDPNTHPTKFEVTLTALFESLDETARTIDRLLDGARDDVREAAYLFLHHCFQTYLDEAALTERSRGGRVDQLPLQQTAWHFYRKNNLVMILWLELRARLLGLDPRDHEAAIRQWGYLLASFQIFDDLKDIALDLGKQPSYPIQIAAADFPGELAWLEAQLGRARLPLCRDDVARVTLHASRTVQRCMQWSRLIALAYFDNTLLYAWDQRWKKSWTRRRGSFNPKGAGTAAALPHVTERLTHALSTLRGPAEAFASPFDDEQLAYALDASAYDGAWEIYVALFPNVRAMYRYATLRMWMTATEKARVARHVLRRYGRLDALVGLAEADVDHEVGGDLLEALPERVEVERLRNAELRHRFEQGAA